MNNIWLTIEKSSNLFGFVALFITLLLYFIEFNFSEKQTDLGNHPGSEANPTTLGNQDVASLSESNPADAGSLGHPIGVTSLASEPTRFAYTTTSLGMVISNIAIACNLGARWVESGHFPLSNLYESLIFLSWTITLVHILVSDLLTGSNNKVASIETETNPSLGNHPGSPTTLGNQNGSAANPTTLGMITTPTALLLNGFASLSLPEEMKASGALVPALQSNWLMMHVTLMILSYGTLILGSLVSILFLVVNQGTQPMKSGVGIPASAGEPERFPALSRDANQDVATLKSLRTLDNLSYRLIGLGFPLLTIGIISGAVWANEAWGSYWSWDPKETWALITWLNFAIYLHIRLNKGWQGEKAAQIASIGFILLWICYLGVNLLGKGLHSYGFFI